MTYSSTGNIEGMGAHPHKGACKHGERNHEVRRATKGSYNRNEGKSAFRSEVAELTGRNNYAAQTQSPSM